MKFIGGLTHVLFSTLFKSSSILLLGIVLIVFCSCMESKSLEAVDDLAENGMIERYYPKIFFDEDLNLIERASPRLGRASPRLGRAAPRFGRRVAIAAANLLSRMNHAGRYYAGDDDETVNDDSFDSDSFLNEKRAAPRLGRSV